MTPIEAVVLRAAADLIARPFGWWQEGSSKPAIFIGSLFQRGTCPVTAIERASKAIGLSAGEGYRARVALFKAIGGRSLQSIFDWNDAPDQTKKAVVRTMREVADAIEWPHVTWTHRDVLVLEAIGQK